jgi:signal transduction histidine kinase
MAISILIVEDELLVAKDIRRFLRGLGYEVPEMAASGAEAVELALQFRPDLILMDVQLNGEMDGIDAVARIRERLDVPVVYLTGHWDTKTRERASENGAFGYVIKPWVERELEIGIEMALAIYARERIFTHSTVHELNNHLMVILGSAECALVGSPVDEQIRDLLSEIQKSGESAIGLSKQLLAVSRVQTLSRIVFDLNEFVRRTLSLLARLVGTDVALDAQLAAGECRIKADPSQLGQILMNLAVNARDAMPDGGELKIRTETRVLTNFRPDLTGHLPPGRYVLLSVADTGHGMDEETRQRALEPFFTTKDWERGTGMGLATIHRIVKQSNGHVHLASHPNRGTTVEVFLPLTDEEPASLVTRAERVIVKSRVPETSQAAACRSPSLKVFPVSR